MKIERLLCFQAVSQFRSFSKAADNLYISQSSLSKNIKALEDELGGALFIRKSNNVVTLSPFGEFISNEINNIIEDYHILISAADSYKINHSKKLTIATFLNIAHSGILRPLTEFEANQDNFYIETIEKEHSMLRMELAMHHVDVCFGYRELIGDAQDYTIFPLFQDPLILVTTKEQAAARGWKGRLNLADLSTVPFLLSKGGPGAVYVSQQRLLGQRIQTSAHPLQCPPGNDPPIYFRGTAVHLAVRQHFSLQIL